MVVRRASEPDFPLPGFSVSRTGEKKPDGPVPDLQGKASSENSILDPRQIHRGIAI
jgi:hypothetical protein